VNGDRRQKLIMGAFWTIFGILATLLFGMLSTPPNLHP